MKNILILFLLILSFEAYSIDYSSSLDDVKYYKGVSHSQLIKLTITVDDLVEHGFTKKDISKIKNDFGCEDKGLILVSKIGKDIVYSKNYPQCWVFKQPFKEFKEGYGYESSSWFLIRYETGGRIEIAQIIKNYGDPWLFKISEDWEQKIFFVNECNHKWMNYSLALDIHGLEHKWKKYMLFNLDGLLNYSYPKSSMAQNSQISFSVVIPNSDKTWPRKLAVPWIYPIGFENLINNNWCKIVYEVELKKVYYEK